MKQFPELQHNASSSSLYKTATGFQIPSGGANSRHNSRSGSLNASTSTLINNNNNNNNSSSSSNLSTMNKNTTNGSSSTSVSGMGRSASASNSSAMIMNRQVTVNDSLFYICLNLKRRLEKVSQLKSYLNLAYSNAELLSENQALLLSQKSGSISSGSLNNHNSFMSSSTNNSLRISRSSNLSNLSEDSSNNSSTLLSASNSNSLTSINTFSAGVLPSNVNCDPVTQLWKLFQQGSPLCIIFNLIKPEYSLPVVSSDDIKTCKKSIYDFILACKNHLKIDHNDLFTISNIFSNETNDLILVVNAITKVIDLAPDIFKKVENVDEIKISDSRSKIIKEMVETERKYVNDLEILCQYKDQLLSNNIILQEDLYMLFPNLNDILDFQRRFLISLEINALVEPKFQRIGSIFIHAQPFFKSYEPWSIGQKAAIDFISSSSSKLKNNSLIIGNDLELQSFILKPVQRLCKYPLLLRELIKHTDPNLPNYHELTLAIEISKLTATDINENQRKAENIEILKKLYTKVIDWRGYNVNSFGELLFFDKIVVKDNSKTSDEREFQVYLFENIIIFFKEIFAVQKKNTISSVMKKSQSNILNSNSNSSSSLNNANNQEVLGLELKGRISIANIYNISTMTTHSLNISWSGLKDTGSFLMRFKNEEIKNNWEQCIRKLVSNLQEELASQQIGQLNSFSFSGSGNRRSNGISLNSNRSSSYLSRSNSDVTNPPSAVGSSNNSGSSNTGSGSAATSNGLPYTHSRQKSEIAMSRRLTQESIQFSKRSISENYKNSLPTDSVIVRLMFDQDLFTLMIPLEITVEEFLSRVDKKIKQCGGTMKGKVKYQDEDGDFIVIQSEDDWVLVKDMINNGEKVLNIWVT